MYYCVENKGPWFRDWLVRELSKLGWRLWNLCAPSSNAPYFTLEETESGEISPRLLWTGSDPESYHGHKILPLCQWMAKARQAEPHKED